jgi:NAD(P)H-flavin reductase
MQVAQNLFDHQLAVAVGIGRATYREILADWYSMRVTIYRGRRTEHDVAHPMLSHHFTQCHGSGHIVIVIAQGLLDRLPH